MFFLVQLKNASLINKEAIKFNYNNFTLKVLSKLYDEGFILSFRANEEVNSSNNFSQALVHIRYMHSKPIFRNLKFGSTSSFQSIYSYKNICRNVAKKKLSLFSTNLGLLNSDECQKHHVGGALLFTC